MAGLAASRHARFSRQSTRNGGYAAANLTVTPAPTGNADNPVPRPPSPPSSLTTTTTTTTPPHPPTTSDAQRDGARRELARYTKIIRRLQWKLPFLAQGYRQAVDRVGADPDAVCEAELMFKLDFFEYYMLVERALVHLLGVFGVDVPRHAPGPGSGPGPGRGRGREGEGSGGGVGGGGGGDGSSNNNNNGKGLGASVWREGRHRYHANVLAALDQEENPLHGALGTGEVRAQLGRAKDLRNRWKTAADEPEHDQGRGGRSPAKGGASPGREWRSRKVAAPLDSYRLEHMLEVIFQGFDEGFRIAEEYVRGERDTDMFESDGRAIDWTVVEDEEDQWEFMVDAMDWEAV
ncbi:hypothetical protein B0I37DRAFT_428535 [Chaetomium sp. MPI-CAGE-AT-0009]|nr:hypothetical protein B0I37DRAFT_428535 [Chaetomium sp. MPI-CAGE-AT-0009]